MTTLASVADITAGYNASAQVRAFSKTAFSTPAGTLVSHWTATGVPTAGAGPGTTFAVCTSATTGALSFANATAGTIRLYELSCSMPTAYRPAFLCDRLAHVSGYSGTATGTQSFGISVVGMAADRLGTTNYSEIVWFFEWYVQTGSSVTATVTYTNGAGTGSRTVNVTIPSSAAARRLVRIIGTDGEPIQSIESVQHSSTGTTGDYGITAVRFIVPMIALAASEPYVANWFETRLAPIPNNACLFFIQSIHNGSGTALDGLATFIDR
jgi:hypothetical protein